MLDRVISATLLVHVRSLASRNPPSQHNANAFVRLIVMLPYALIRPLLFSLDPELAHRITFDALSSLRQGGLASLFRQRIADDPREVMGLRFPNPVGLAAGLDKDARHIDTLADLGFGFIEVGTVTPRPQQGNPKPRLFRLPQAQALINRMGFNNNGVQALVERVRASKFYKRGGVIGINIGKNATTPIEQATDDYVHCLKHAYEVASYIAVNISSPNTKDLRRLQYGDELDALLSRLDSERQRLADAYKRRVPIAVKIAPDLDVDDLTSLAATFERHSIDAVIATNTTLSRTSVQGLPFSNEVGGLSGLPVEDASNRIIATLIELLGDRIPIIGVGGIFSGESALRKIDAGAKLLQIYSGLIYEGPKLIRSCVDAVRSRQSVTAAGDH